MKKYLIYASVLAVAACGGGGGGGSSPISGARAPVFNSSDLFSNTEDNSNVTQMKTQVIVDSHGNVINTSRRATIRSGSIQDTNGNTYALYDLSDVKLNVADEVPAWLKIGLAEDGAIQDITLSSGAVESKLAREGNTNTFRGPIFEYADSGDHALYRMVDGTDFSEELRNIDGFEDSLDANGKATMDTLDLIATHKGLSGGHWNLVDERMDVQTNKHISAGDANAIKLNYSDFGHFNPVYRTKHKDLNASVLTAIRAHSSEIEAALSDENFDQEDFDTLVSGYGLKRDGKDEYRNNDEFNEKLEQEDYQLFAGGYAINANGQLIESGTFEAPRNTIFTGKGIGRVYTSIKANAGGTEKEYRAAVLDQYGIAHDDTEESILNAGHKVAKEFKTSSATLEVKANGDQELVMNFPDFYRVTATQLAAGGDPTIVLDKPTGVTIEKQYMKTGDVAVQTTGDYRVTNNGTQYDPEVMFKPGYYGVGTASEAAGLIRYATETDDIVVTKTTDPSDSKTFTREFEFQGAYGMKN